MCKISEAEARQGKSWNGRRVYYRAIRRIGGAWWIIVWEIPRPGTMGIGNLGVVSSYKAWDIGSVIVAFRCGMATICPDEP